MNANGKLVAALVKSEVYQRYESAYTGAIGMPLALREIETEELPLHRKPRENPWCAMMAEKNSTCAGCRMAQAALSRMAMSKGRTITCIYGLCETAVPIKLGKETIGFLQTGQVMKQKPTDDGFEQAVAHAKKLGAKLNPEKAHQAYFNTPVVSPKTLKSITHLLAVFAEHLSLMSNQISVQISHAEPSVISKARQFIEEHHRENLELGQVAASVHISIFYFCKMFKKVTGVNFTEYVCRLRTEKAKTLLLNPNLRISEIGYEVGFQSLTHFNRVFKKITGQAPRTYRDSLKLA